MSAAKLQSWRPDKKAKDFFSDARPVVIPDELIPDGKLHTFIFQDEAYGYVAGHDKSGEPFVMVTRTYRPPIRKIQAPTLRCIDGGKQ